MHAIVLAAGLGSRLGRDVPKPCVVVAGKALLAWTIDFARRAGASSITIVAGHRAEVVTALARECGVDDVVVNDRFADGGNLLSLLAARAAGRVRFPLLLSNADHVYRAGIAHLIAKAAEQQRGVTAFIDRDRALGPDDMKVELDEAGALRAIDKKLSAWDVGYVGATLVSREASAEYLAAVDATADAIGASAHVEAVLARLAASSTPPRVADVSGIGWFEVDDEADLAKAEVALRESPREQI